MANELDEMTGPVAEEGRDANVINKQIPIKVGVGSTIFQVMPANSTPIILSLQSKKMRIYTKISSNNDNKSRHTPAKTHSKQA